LHDVFVVVLSQFFRSVVLHEQIRSSTIGWRGTIVGEGKESEKAIERSPGSKTAHNMRSDLCSSFGRILFSPLLPSFMLAYGTS
jgi:hypothetical protein